MKMEVFRTGKNPTHRGVDIVAPEVYGVGYLRRWKTAASNLPCKRVTLETAVRQFQGWPASRV
jgi:hypothetical protein